MFALDRQHPDPAESFDERVSFLVGDVTDLECMTRVVETIGRDPVVRAS